MVTVQVENDNLEKAIRKFRKEVEREGIIEVYRKRQYFVKPSAVRHRKKVYQQHRAEKQSKQEN